MTTLNIRLTDWIEQRLNEEAARENKTRSEVACDALTWYLTEIEKKRASWINSWKKRAKHTATKVSGKKQN